MADATVMRLLRLPWENFLVGAYEANQERLEDLEAENDPNSKWQLETPLFHFTHLVWSRPDLGADAHQPATVFTKIERTLKQWSAARKRNRQEPPYGLAGDPWHEWFDIGRVDARTEFLDLWPRFRFPAGQLPLDAAVQLARRTVLIPAEEVCLRRAIERDNPTIGYCFFISVCGHLQAMVGDKSILLPEDQLAERLRVTGRTVSRWRQWAAEDGMLRQTAPPGRRRATEYRFKIDGWSALKKKAPPGTAEGFAR